MGVRTGLHRAAERIRHADGKKLLIQAGALASKQMLALAAGNTPADSGELKRSWQLKRTEQDANGLRIEVENSAGYASFVEEGHRQTPERFVPAIGKALVEDFVPGQFFLREAEAQYRENGGAVLEEMLAEKMRKVFSGDQ